MVANVGSKKSPSLHLPSVALPPLFRPGQRSDHIIVATYDLYVYPRTNERTNERLAVASPSVVTLLPCPYVRPFVRERTDGRTDEVSDS